MLSDNFPNWQKLFTKENITFVLALAGFALSLHTHLKQRKSFSARILKIRSYNSTTYMYISFENRSQLPIAITRMIWLLGQNHYDATYIPKKVIERTRRFGKEVISRTQEHSSAFPIQLQSLGATSALILFESLPELPADDATHLTFLIGTNRGKAMQMTLELPAGWAAHRKGP